MKHFFLRVALAAGASLLPLAAMAATVSFSSVTVPMGKNYTVSGDFSSATTSASSLSVTLAQNETVTIVSPDNTKLTFDQQNVPSFTETCGSSSYEITFTKKTSGSQSFTVSPSSNTCSTGGGGGGGGSGTTGTSGGTTGGGGGPGPTPPAPAPAPAPAPVPTPPPAAPVFGITSDLALGSEGNDVAQLQAYLATDPSIYPEALITGYYGAKTQAAVKRFQAKHGLPQVGRVGPLTRAKLKEIFGAPTPPAPTPPPPAGTPPPPATPGAVAFTRGLSVGSRGDDVEALQSYLAQDPDIYPEGLATGYYGPATRRAIQRFQEKYSIAGPGVPGYGTVGPKTRAKLNELLAGGAVPPPPPVGAPPPPAAPADDAAKIKELEDRLKALQDQLKALQ